MNILQAVMRAGTTVKKVATTNGGEYAGPCPGCGGTDRFRVWPEDKGGEGSYWCRGCGSGGDLVQFLVDFCRMEYPEAFREAGRETLPSSRSGGRVRDHLPKAPSPRSFEPREYDPPVETWRIKAGKLVDYAHQHLLQNPAQCKRLEQRGISLDVIKAFRLGWNPGEKDKHAVYRPRRSWGLPVIKKDNGREKMLWIPRGLVIPFFKNGVIQRIRIRRPWEDLKREQDVRYYVLPGSSMEPMMILPDKKAFVVVESELDAMMLSRIAGAVAGVVALGTALAKPGGEAFGHLKKALRILVALDADPAGAQGWEWWQNEFRNARRWPVPAGKDPGEAFEKGLNLLQWVVAGLPPVLTIRFAQADPDCNEPDPMPQEPERGFATNEIPWYPPSLAEIRQLLNRYPFKIRASQGRTSLLWTPGTIADPIQKRISHLTFFDLDVSEYLDAHPADIIHGGNFDLA